jgi:hypothetical protein
VSCSSAALKICYGDRLWTFLRVSYETFANGCTTLTMRTCQDLGGVDCGILKTGMRITLNTLLLLATFLRIVMKLTHFCTLMR